MPGPKSEREHDLDRLLCQYFDDEDLPISRQSKGDLIDTVKRIGRALLQTNTELDRRTKDRDQLRYDIHHLRAVAEDRRTSASAVGTITEMIALARAAKWTDDGLATKQRDNIEPSEFCHIRKPMWHPARFLRLQHNTDLVEEVTVTEGDDDKTTKTKPYTLDVRDLTDDMWQLYVVSEIITVPSLVSYEVRYRGKAQTPVVVVANLDSFEKAKADIAKGFLKAESIERSVVIKGRRTLVVYTNVNGTWTTPTEFPPEPCGIPFGPPPFMWRYW